MTTITSKKIINLLGNKYNKLLVISYSHYFNERTYWNCLCDCGKSKVISGPELKRGGVKSCGCLCAENGLRRRKIRPPKLIKEKRGRVIQCASCGVDFYLTNCFINTKNYCSRRCHHEGISQGKFIKKPCLECGKNYGVHQWFLLNRGSNYCSNECKRKGMAKTQSGENCHWWKGGVSYAGKRIRKGIEWKDWRTAVFQRDNYTCQDCGTRSAKGIKVELHPHHIKQFALYPELRFDPNNGITLCKDCHKKTDTYLKPLKSKAA